MISKLLKFPMRQKWHVFRCTSARETTPHLIIYYKETKSASRLAVVLGLKNHRRATVRTAFRRFTFDNFWPLLVSFGLDVVIVYRPLALTKCADSFSVIKKELVYISSKICTKFIE